MTEPTAVQEKMDLAARFPEVVTADTRPGYEGYIVDPARILDVARNLRDDLGYDYLASLTGVDYLPEGKMEVVYHLCKTTGGPVLNLKVQLPRENPVVDSIVSIYPGGDFPEREAWDLLGIRFEGHPDLRRIMMWEGFAGHPLRKDWKEPYFEEEAKPFKSRWPEGEITRAETRNPFHDNVQFPADFDPSTWTPEVDTALYDALTRSVQASGSDLKTDTLVVNMGPQHPSTHGVFRMVAALDGETVIGLKPAMGYLHRNHEKIGERNNFLGIMPFTDRLDYVSSLSNNFGYALAVEKLMGIKPPERAEYIRVIMAELTRISSHMMAIGFLLNDLGAFFTPALYGLKERELILDIFEAVTGSRMMCNYFRFGGVARDFPAGILEKIKGLVNNRLPVMMDDFIRYLIENEILRNRTQGVGVLTTEQAIALFQVVQCWGEECAQIVEQETDRHHVAADA
ncbi:MAG TPA: NADH-quinone oxidoreductase subunit C, partial [Anaerolineaceae bacterium]|nr:NADH-quinone oxidoreductase subunit C [Anaerolineaceae bacterium]